MATITVSSDTALALKFCRKSPGAYFLGYIAALYLLCFMDGIKTTLN